jgi:hypothetical protein
MAARALPLLALLAACGGPHAQAPVRVDGEQAPLPALTPAERAKAGLDEPSVERWRLEHNNGCTERAASFADWREVRPPGDRDRCANRDECDWRVSLLDGRITVRPRVVGGSDVDVGGEKWMMVGLDHMTAGTGAVYRVVPAGDGWALTEVARLEQSAYAAATEGSESALVVTRTQLVRVTRAGQVMKLHEGPWDGLYPSTVLVDSAGRVLIGARHAVIRLEPRGGAYSETWLVSPSCVQPGALTCSCPSLE